MVKSPVNEELKKQTGFVSFEALFKMYDQSMYGQAIRYTKNPDDAQDLVQEAKLRIFRFMPSYTSQTNLGAWIYTIVRNTFINEYRRRQRRRESTFKENYIQEALKDSRPLQDRDSLESLFEEVCGNNLEDAPEFKEVLYLRAVEDMNYQEIADHLGIPIGTVMSRLNRARQRIPIDAALILRD